MEGINLILSFLILVKKLNLPIFIETSNNNLENQQKLHSDFIQSQTIIISEMIKCINDQKLKDLEKNAISLSIISSPLGYTQIISSSEKIADLCKQAKFKQAVSIVYSLKSCSNEINELMKDYFSIRLKTSFKESKKNK